MTRLRQKNSFKDNQFTEKLGFSPIGINGWHLGLFLLKFLIISPGLVSIRSHLATQPTPVTQFHKNNLTPATIRKRLNAPRTQRGGMRCTRRVPSQAPGIEPSSIQMTRGQSTRPPKAYTPAGMVVSRAPCITSRLTKGKDLRTQI
jgi:hypothetical protein